MKITINFDMDGTIADLYAMEDWLPKLRAENPEPYALAKPLLNMSALARRLNRLQKEGYQIAIISWLSKESSQSYDMAVAQAKREWLAKHLPSVHWDRITIVPYGTPKETFADTLEDILFDDEERNREAWTGKAFAESAIMSVLQNLKEVLD